MNYIAPENTKFTFGYKTIDDTVDSETIYKLVDGSLPSTSSVEVNCPYGTKINLNNKDIYTANANGIFAWYYGTQTEKLKTLFGFYSKDGEVTLGVFTYNIESGDIKFLKVLYSTTKGHLQDEFILKKLLHGSAGKVATDLNLNLITITPSGEIITISDPTLNEIPQTIVLKEKARKIMFFKMFVKSEELACEFDRFYIEFRMSGKYRGE